MCEQCEKFLRYNFSTNVYTAQSEIVLDPLCNGISVKNGGNTNLIFQGDVLVPGESKSIGGNRKEILQGRVDISFALPTPAPGTPNNVAFVTQKFYYEPCEKPVFE